MDAAAFVDFYDGYRSRCLRAAVASGMSREEAEEAVAEAFSRAWASWSSVGKMQSPAAWVVRVAVNANVSWWRKRRREVLEHSDPEPHAPELGEATDDLDLLRAIAALPPRQRQVVVLRYLLDMDTYATARSMGIAPGTVKATLHHALSALRESLSLAEENVR